MTPPHKFELFCRFGFENDDFLKVLTLKQNECLSLLEGRQGPSF